MSELTSNDLSSEPKVLSLDRINRLIRYARDASKPWLCVDVVAALEELKRHRKIEHDHFWGEDDE